MSDVPASVVLEYVDKLRKSPDLKTDRKLLAELQAKAEGSVPVAKSPPVENSIPGQIDIYAALDHDGFAGADDRDDDEKHWTGAIGDG